MKTKTVLAALIIATATAVSGTASAQQEGAIENINLYVNCRDSAELTRQICFPYEVKNLDVQLLPIMTGWAQITDQQIEGGGCVRVKVSAYGERQYPPESPSSFESRAAKSHDPLQVPQCIPTNATAIVRVKY